jgi:hypothetical protein
MPAPFARSATLCFGYGHAFVGRKRPAIDKDSLKRVEGEYQCQGHWRKLGRRKKVRA